METVADTIIGPSAADGAALVDVRVVVIAGLKGRYNSLIEYAASRQLVKRIGPADGVSLIAVRRVRAAAR